MTTKQEEKITKAQRNGFVVLGRKTRKDGSVEVLLDYLGLSHWMRIHA